MELEKTKWVRLSFFITLLLLGIYLISPFIIPIVFGATISLALFPLHQKFKRKIPNKLSAALLACGFTFIISIPFTFFAARGGMLLSEQIEKWQHDARYKDQEVSTLIKVFKDEVVERIETFGHSLGFPLKLTDDQFLVYVQKASNYLVDFFQNIASSLPNLALFLLLMIVCIYSFLNNSKHLAHFFQEILGLTDRDMSELTKKFITSSQQVYLTNLITGSVQSVMVALASTFLGLFDFFLVFFITLVLSFIPVIGAAPVAFLIGIFAFFQDEAIAGVIMLVVGGVAGVVDNLLRPYLASFGDSNIPALPAFVFVVGGAFLMGFPGLFIGLLVGSFIFDTLPFFWGKMKGKNPDVQIQNLKVHEVDTFVQHKH